MRIALWTAILVVAAVGWLMVGPQQLGGPLAAVSTYGDSMLPTYRPHEAVVVRRASEYHTGEVIAYRSAQLDTVVLHRIVGVDDEGLVTRGDNNDWLDADRPRHDDVIGRAWFSIPHVGRLLELPPAGRAVLPLGVMAGLGVGARRHPGRADRRHGSRPQRTPAPARGSGLIWSGPGAQLLVVAALALVAGGALAAVAWTRPTSQPGPVPYTQHGRFDYNAPVPPGPVYPDGRLDAGEPIFLRLADRLEVSFDWSFESDAPSDIHGSGQLVAVVEDGSGWRRSLPVGTPTAWSGPRASLSGDLDIAHIRRLAAEVARATGVGGGNQTVTLTADLTIEGELAHVPLRSHVTPSLVFSVDELRAVLTSPTAPADPSSDPLTVTEAGLVTAPAVEVSRLQFGGWRLSTATARQMSVGVVGLAVMAALAGTALAWRTRGWDEHRRIAARYGPGIVEVAALSPAGDRTLVAVTSFERLAQVADQRELPVLRVPIRTGGYGYVVDDTTARYRYLIQDRAGSADARSAPPRGSRASATTDTAATDVPGPSALLVP